MTVEQLIEHLQHLNPQSLVLVPVLYSCRLAEVATLQKDALGNVIILSDE